MTRIVGTGCALSAVAASCASHRRAGQCQPGLLLDGEKLADRAAERKESGSFIPAFLDALYHLMWEAATRNELIGSDDCRYDPRAGIRADLKIFFSALGAYGCSVITALVRKIPWRCACVTPEQSRTLSSPLNLIPCSAMCALMYHENRDAGGNDIVECRGGNHLQPSCTQCGVYYGDVPLAKSAIRCLAPSRCDRNITRPVAAAGVSLITPNLPESQR